MMRKTWPKAGSIWALRRLRGSRAFHVVLATMLGCAAAGVLAVGPAAAAPSAGGANHRPTISFQMASISGFSATIKYTLNRGPHQIAGLACSLGPSGGETSVANCGVVTSSSKESTTRVVTIANLRPGDYSYAVSARLTDGSRFSNSTNLTVVPVPANCTVTNYSLTYDGATHTATGTCTGVDGVNLTAGLDLSGTSHTDAGTYDSDSWSFTDPAGNYATSGGTLFNVIRQATADCTVTGYSLTYDGNTHTATGTCTGVGGVKLTAGLDLSGTSHTDAGTYDRDSWSFTDPAGNYTTSGGTLFNVIRPATAD